MATSQRPAAQWKTAVVAGAAALAVTGGVAAPASAAPQPGSAADRLSIGNQDLHGDVQLGEPAHPRDPGGRRHHWIVKAQYGTGGGPDKGGKSRRAFCRLVSANNHGPAVLEPVGAGHRLRPDPLRALRVLQ
ncbi:hypothetical protein [Kitasatospora sp. NPDC056531]|uniref:hypothetical protein n=1 Tax=Kitasatospora sp. NPDC056531 TaxID=3345856 RepID=UPI0036A57520